MPKFKITADGKTYLMTAPDQASAVAAFSKFTGQAQQPTAPQDASPGNGGTSDAASPYFQGLALPGQQQPPGAPPVNTVPQTQRFGLTSADSLNPLPAIAAAGDAAVGQLPIIGKQMQGWRDRVNADIYGGTPEQARADIERTTAANPVASVAGKIAGQTLPYMAASEVPLLNSALGFSGPWFQRLAMTMGSQYAINTGDNLAHGQDLNTAAKNGAIASIASAPFALLGKGKAPEGAQSDAVAVMRKEGIPLTAGQQKGSKVLMTAESQLGGAATSAFQDRQLSALTSAALKRAGVDAKAATPTVLRDAYDKIGSKFDRLAAMTKVRVDGQLQNDLLKAATDYQDLVGQPAPIVEKFINRVGTLAQQNAGGAGKRFVPMDVGDKMGFEWSWSRSPDTGMAAVKFGDKVYSAQTHQEAMQKAVAVEGAGARAELNAHPELHLGYEVSPPKQPLMLKGDNYKVLVTDLREAASNSSSNEVKAALNQMRAAIDDAVERSMGGQSRSAWQVLRQQYKNLIHVTDAVAGAGEKAAKGLMTPASLRQAISSGDKRNYAKGYGDLNELSHAANITMTPIPDSGTTGRLASVAGISAVPAAAAALSAGNPGHAAAVLGGLALPSLAGRALLSAPGRHFIGRGGSAIPAAVARGVLPQTLPPLVQQMLGP